jgi:hypothetical protein
VVWCGQLAVCTRSGRVQCVSALTGRVLCQYQLDLSQTLAVANANKKKAVAEAAAAADAKDSKAAQANSTTPTVWEHAIKGVGVIGRSDGAQRSFVTCLDTGRISVLRFRPLASDSDSSDSTTNAAAAATDSTSSSSSSSASGAAAASSSSDSSASAAADSAIDPDLALHPTAADIVREFEAGSGVCRMRLYEGSGSKSAGGSVWLACGGKERLMSVWDVCGTSNEPVWVEKNVSPLFFVALHAPMNDCPEFCDVLRVACCVLRVVCSCRTTT